MGIQGRVLSLCSVVALVGCGAAADKGMTGIVGWWQDAAASTCLCPANASECTATDCALTGVRDFNADGSYRQGVVMLSSQRMTVSVIEMFRGHYEPTGDMVRFTPDDGSPFVVMVSRSGDRLTVDNLVQVRTADWLAAAIENTTTSTARSR